jgi:beta-barrel assembly-enhancing protease
MWQKLLLSLVALICILSCAAPKSRVPTATTAQVAQEKEIQKRLAFESNYNINKKIFQPFLKASSAFYNFGNCSNVKYISGFSILDAKLFSPEYRDIARSVHKIDKYPKVGSVVEGFPVYDAGLRPGVEIISISGVDCSQNNCLNIGANDRQTVLVIKDKNGNQNKLQFDRIPICDVDLKVLDNQQINAATDGKSIFITKGLIKFADSDDELMMVIAHEYGHMINKHIEMAQQNRAAGAAGGLVLDIAAAALRINTGGAFSKAASQTAGAMYSQEMEYEADYFAVYFLANADCDLQKGINVFRKLAAENPSSIEASYRSSHPSTPERFTSMANTIAEIQLKKDNGLPLSPETKNTENTTPTYKKQPSTIDNEYANLPKPLNELPPKTTVKKSIPSGGNVKQDYPTPKSAQPTKITDEGHKVWEIIGKGMDIDFYQLEAAGRPILGKDITVGDSFIIQGKEFKLLKNSGWITYYNEHKSVYETTFPSMKPIGIRAPKDELVIITVLKPTPK